MSGLARRLRRVMAQKSVEVKVDRPRHVAICTPLGDHVHTAFAASLLQMVIHTLQAGPRDASVTFHNYSSSILPYSRNVITKSALDGGATHLLWIDSDMDFPPDMLIRLLKHDLPIVGANCTMRQAPHRNTARLAGDVELVTTIESSGLEKVERTGFGVVMVKAEVFEAMELPWFAFEWIPEKGVFRGEDYRFFLNARALGYECVIDQDVSKQVRHMGSFGYSPVIKAIGESLTENT